MLFLADHEQQLIAAAGFQEEDEDEDEDDEEEDKEPLTPGQIKMKAAYQMLLGTALVAFVADPMVCVLTMGSVAKATSAVPSGI